MPGSSSTTNNGSTERPGFPPLRPSNKKSQGAQASRCATKRSRFGSSPCARISHITSHSRSGLWQRQNRPPKRVNRAPARTASESVHCASCRATRKGSCAQAAPARSGKYGGLTVTKSNSFSAADGLQSLKSPQAAHRRPSKRFKRILLRNWSCPACWISKPVAWASLPSRHQKRGRIPHPVPKSSARSPHRGAAKSANRSASAPNPCEWEPPRPQRFQPLSRQQPCFACQNWISHFGSASRKAST